MTAENLYPTLSSAEQSKLLMPFSPLSFDLDGVVVYSVENALDLVNKRHGTNFSLLDITHSYRLDDLYREAVGCTKEEASAYMASVWHSVECMEDSKPVKGALALLTHLDQLKIEYHFVSSRPFSVFAYTENWFKKNGLENKFMRSLMQTSDTFNRRHKVETIRSYDIKIHFEDMREHALDIVDNTEALVVLVNYPANEDLPDNPRIIRPINRKDYGNLLASYEALLSHLVNKGFVAQG